MKQTQKERILRMLRERPVSNYEFRTIHPPMFQYPVRIFELRKEGYNIVTHKDPHDKKKIWYELNEGEQLKLAI